MPIFRFFRSMIVFGGLCLLACGATAPVWGQSQPAAMAMQARIQQNGVGGAAPIGGGMPLPGSGPVPQAVQGAGPNAAGPNGAALPANGALPTVPQPVELRRVEAPNFTYKLHTDKVTSLAISAQGYACLSGSADATAQIWRIRNFTPEDFAMDQQERGVGPEMDQFPNQQFPNQQRPNPVAPPDNLKSVLGKRLALFAEGHRQGITSVAISPYEDYVYTASYDTSIRRWSVDSGVSKKKYMGAKDRLWHIAVTSGDEIIAGACNDGKVYFWDSNSGKVKSSVKACEGPVFDAEFSLDASRLVTAGSDGSVTIFRIPALTKAQTLTGHKDKVFTAVFSPDGRFVLTASRDKTARLWDAASGKELCRIIGHEGAVRQAIFLDGGRMATCSDDKTVRIWSTTIALDGGAMNPNHPAQPQQQQQGFGHFSGFQDDEEDENAADPGLAESLFGDEDAPIAAGPDAAGAGPAVPIERAAELVRFAAPDALFSVAANSQVLLAGCNNGEVFLWELAPLFPPPATENNAPNAPGGARPPKGGQGW